MTAPICINCQHCVQTTPFWLRLSRPKRYMCSRRTVKPVQPVQNLITGELTPREPRDSWSYCENERAPLFSADYCGPRGRFYVERSGV